MVPELVVAENPEFQPCAPAPQHDGSRSPEGEVLTVLAWSTLRYQRRGTLHVDNATRRAHHRLHGPGLS